jgi:hypothetical protein
MSNLPAGVTDDDIEQAFYGEPGDTKYTVTVVYTVYATSEKEAEELALTGNEWDHEVKEVEAA